MTNYYHSSSAYRSLLDRSKPFNTEDEAHAHDRVAAATIINRRTEADIVTAMHEGDAELEKALAYVLEELRGLPMPIAGAK
jgi:hypothetical protein